MGIWGEPVEMMIAFSQGKSEYNNEPSIKQSESSSSCSLTLTLTLFLPDLANDFAET